MEITDEFQTVTPFEISLLWLPLKNITLMKKAALWEHTQLAHLVLLLLLFARDLATLFI